MDSAAFLEQRREKFRRIADEALEVIKLTSELIEELCRGYGVFKLYNSEHAEAKAATERILHGIRALFYNRRVITIDVGLRRFLVNHLPIYEISKASSELHTLFREKEIGGMTFVEGIDQDQIALFMKYLGECSLSDKKRDWLQEQLKKLKVDKIVVEMPMLEDMVQAPDDDDDEDEEEQPDTPSNSLVQNVRTRIAERTQKNARKLYQVAVGTINDIMNAAHHPDQINIKDITRIAHNIFEVMQERPEEMLAMAIAGRIGNYQYLHPVNVSIFGLMLARPLITENRRLIEFIRIALLYDVGKSYLPSNILQKSDSLKPEEIYKVHQHPIMSANVLDRHTELDKLAVVVAYEHHLSESKQGYPRTEYQWETNLITRIIQVVETFDALIGNDTYHDVVPPKKAFEELLTQYENKPEALLVTRLMKIIGIYPVGTPVLLNTKEIGIVTGQTKGRYDHPMVKIISDADTNLTSDGEICRTGKEKTVIGTIPLRTMPLNLLDYFPFNK